MKELDVLLESFLAKHESGLAQGAWPEFEALLDLEDDQLWDLLQRPQVDGTGQFAALADSIRRGK